MAVEFNGKIFNAEVFIGYLNTIPATNTNALLLQSGVFRDRPDWLVRLADQTGGNYILEHYRGRPNPADVQKYDGLTDIEGKTTTTYERGVIAVGHAYEMFERDYTYELTHDDFFIYLAGVAAQYRADVDEADLLGILKGIEGVTDFAKHVIDTDDVIGATTINTVIQQACGDYKSLFRVVVVDSFVATQLENLNIVTFATQNDAQGIQRPTRLGYVNGLLLVIDDRCPVEDGKHTCYALGQDAFDYCDLGVKVPAEVARDPEQAGGTDKLIYRWRCAYAPAGFSFNTSTFTGGSTCPDKDDLATSGNWSLAKNADATALYPEKAIPICIFKVNETATADEGEGEETPAKTSVKTAKAED